MREIAILNTGDGVDISDNILKYAANLGHVTMFTKEDKPSEDDGVSYVKIPDDIVNSRSKVSNFAYRHYFDLEYKGFLHVIEDRVLIFNDPSSFVNEIEKMMAMLKLKSWFSTVCDPCNYTFKQYNPNFSVDLDSEDVKGKYGKTIFFTTHANPSWACFDYGTATYDDIRFDDRFSIPMYYIIEFLARRRNTKKENELYFMNCYPTVAEERNVFKLIENYNESEPTQEQFNTEGEIFKSMNVDTKADMMVEPVMESLHFMLTH